MRGVRYIKEQPNFSRTRRGAAVPLDPVVLGGLSLALGLMAWVGLGQTDAQSPSIAAQAGAAALAATPASTAKLTTGGVFKDCADCPEMVVVPSGYVVLGADPADPLARPQETPRRGGSILRPIAVGRYEVTVAQFAAFLASTGGSAPGCDDLATNAGQPQNCLSYGDTIAYVRWLSAKSGQRYRLPTAEEWEYAANAHGTIGREPAEAFEAAGGPRRVADTMANGFGLHGMSGNVAELVAGCWGARSNEDSAALDTCEKHTVKDASWLDSQNEARPSAQRAIRPDLRSVRVGVRIVRDIARHEMAD